VRSKDKKERKKKEKREQSPKLRTTTKSITISLFKSNTFKSHRSVDVSIQKIMLNKKKKNSPFSKKLRAFILKTIQA